jgi:3-methylcrotonyl-CoA carboxylase alpha subunit
MFKKVLIANRGEIAVRIAKTLQEMGIKVVAIYSNPDSESRHLLFCDEAYPLHGTTPAETYLHIEKILDIAQKANVDAIHPGYGFLSENPLFAKACQEVGIVFIGPSAEAIEALGDKLEAKKMAQKAGVPIVPEIEWNESLSPKRIQEKIGFPVLIKAVAGGGGKGVRLVEKEDALLPAIKAAKHEAQSAFGDDRIFLEKFLVKPRHIEFQIFGDLHGNYVHLFERECSIQRRYQKIVEESPSPALSPKLRAQMGEAAIKCAQSAGYANAGTVEFLVDQSGNFYFLEMNTRLQVEHPVTEMVVHHDLVRAQILVAQGEKLPFHQEKLKQNGHAFECRIYAEDPMRNFLPSIGTLEVFEPPEGPNIRLDTGVAKGSKITVDYDPLLAKLITWGEERSQSLHKMLWALKHFVVLGVTTNISFLQKLFLHPAFQKGELHTQFLSQHTFYQKEAFLPEPEEAWIAAALVFRALKTKANAKAFTHIQKKEDPWDKLGAWRMV